MNYAAIFWLVLMLVLLAMEASTVTLVSAWFAMGSLAALVIALVRLPLWVQVVAFLAVSVLTLVSLRPMARKYLKPRLTKTNVDTIPGSQALVTQAIDNLKPQGQVKLGSMEWTARSVSGEPIAEGTLVRVDRIEGVKLIVTPIK